MFRKIAISAVSALALTTGVAFASGAETHTEDLAFSFEGPFGTFDEHQLQRGLQAVSYTHLDVYKRQEPEHSHPWARPSHRNTA